MLDQVVQALSYGTDFIGNLKGLPHLPEDLRFTKDEGIEAGRHTKHMKECSHSLVEIDRSIGHAPENGFFQGTQRA
jgi:hypothetical protein